MSNASVGLRVVEGIIDLVVCVAILWIVAYFTGATTESGFDLTGFPAALGFLLCFAYFIVLEATMGATIGKLVLKLRVVKEADGSPIGWRDSIVRNVLRIVDGFVLYLIGFILICTSPKRQRLGDRVAGTLVVPKVG